MCLSLKWVGQTELLAPLFPVAEPVFHSSVEKHVCYTPSPGSVASFPCTLRGPGGHGDGVTEAPWITVAAGTVECTGSTTVDFFLTPFKADGIGQNVRW